MPSRRSRTCWIPPQLSIGLRAWLDGHRLLVEATLPTTALPAADRPSGSTATLAAIVDVDAGTLTPIADPFAHPPAPGAAYDVIGSAGRWRDALAPEPGLVDLVDQVTAGGADRVIALTRRVQALCSFHGEANDYCRAHGLGAQDHFSAIAVGSSSACESCEMPPAPVEAALAALYRDGSVRQDAFWGGFAPSPTGPAPGGVTLVGAWDVTQAPHDPAAFEPGLSSGYVLEFRSLRGATAIGGDDATGFLLYVDPGAEAPIAAIQPETPEWSGAREAGAQRRRVAAAVPAMRCRAISLIGTAVVVAALLAVAGCSRGASPAASPSATPVRDRRGSRRRPAGERAGTPGGRRNSRPAPSRGRVPARRGLPAARARQRRRRNRASRGPNHLHVPTATPTPGDVFAYAIAAACATKRPATQSPTYESHNGKGAVLRRDERGDSRRKSQTACAVLHRAGGGPLNVVAVGCGANDPAGRPDCGRAVVVVIRVPARRQQRDAGVCGLIFSRHRREPW